MERIKLSIILPVYRVEKYIKRCLESILPQLTSEVELISVDDCSPDRSIDVCKELIKDWSQIQLISRKTNGGLSAARNTGLALANGRYCWFIDSDDSIELQSIERIIHYLNHKDVNILIFNHTRVNEAGERISISQLKEQNIIIEDESQKMQILCDYLINKFGFEVWGKVFSMKIIKENNLDFAPNNKIFAEDICFTLLYLYYCPDIHILEESFYFYLIRSDSIMGSKNTSKLNEMYSLSNLIFNLMEDRYFKQYYNLIYSGIMQIEYNNSKWCDIFNFLLKHKEDSLLFRLNKSVLENKRKHFEVYSKKTSLTHILYAKVAISILQGKELEYRFWRYIINKVL